MNRQKKIRWGILGTGKMAAEFAEALEKVEGAEIYAIGSRTAGAATKFAERFNIPHRFESYEDLVDDENIDVVYVATPPAMHQRDTLLCLEHDKAVLCEKPFALNAREAEAMINKAQERDVFLMEAMWTRFVPSIVELRRILDKGDIGKVQLMIAGGAYIPEFDPDYYLFDRALGGGILLDSGVYMVSMSSMLFGSPISVKASGELGKHGVDDHEAMLLTHAGGEISSLYVSHRGQASPDVTLIGEKGKIHVHAPIFCPPGLTVSVNGEADHVIDFPSEVSGYRHQAVEVNRCLEEGRVECSIMPLDETLNIMRTMDEIRRDIGMTYPGET